MNKSFALRTGTPPKSWDPELERRLHWNMPPPIPAIRESFRIDEDQRKFDKTVQRWTVAILLAMTVIGGSAVCMFIASLPE